MAGDLKGKEEKEKGSFAYNFLKWSGIVFPFAAGILIVVGIIFFCNVIYYTNETKIDALIKDTPPDQGIIYIASWIILIAISIMTTYEVREVMKLRSEDIHRRRANLIAVIVALIIIVFLFKQPFLDALFKGEDTSALLKTLLAAGAAGSGWIVWYLKQIQKYGEFFYVLLLTIVIGFCWYARLTAPSEVQITAVAFLVASLFRIAKDYLDNAEPDAERANKTNSADATNCAAD